MPAGPGAKARSIYTTSRTQKGGANDHRRLGPPATTTTFLPQSSKTRTSNRTYTGNHRQSRHPLALEEAGPVDDDVGLPRDAMHALASVGLLVGFEAALTIGPSDHVVVVAVRCGAPEDQE